MNRAMTSLSTRSLAAVAAGAIGLFPLIVISLNLIQRTRYSTTKQAISELALGTGGTFMAIAFCSLGLGIGLLAVLIRHTRPTRWAITVLLTIAAVLAGPISAAFHTDLTGARTTVHGTIHNLAGLAAFLLILAAMITASIQFRHDAAWRSHARPTVVLTALALVTFVLILILGSDRFGLAQRMFVGTFVTWLLATATRAHRAATRAGHRGLAGGVDDHQSRLGRGLRPDVVAPDLAGDVAQLGERECASTNNPASGNH